MAQLSGSFVPRIECVCTMVPFSFGDYIYPSNLWPRTVTRSFVLESVWFRQLWWKYFLFRFRLVCKYDRWCVSNQRLIGRKIVMTERCLYALGLWKHSSPKKWVKSCLSTLINTTLARKTIYGCDCNNNAESTNRLSRPMTAIPSSQTSVS